MDIDWEALAREEWDTWEPKALARHYTNCMRALLRFDDSDFTPAQHMQIELLRDYGVQGLSEFPSACDPVLHGIFAIAAEGVWKAQITDAQPPVEAMRALIGIIQFVYLAGRSSKDDSDVADGATDPDAAAS